MYLALTNLKAGMLPYVSSKLEVFGVVKAVPVNLNPPTVFFLFYPLGLFSFKTALLLFNSFAIFAGAIAAHLSLKLGLDPTLYKNYKGYFWLGVALNFVLLLNVAIAQLGLILSFLLIVGFYFYQQEKLIRTALFWSAAIAVKLFPGLLLVYLTFKKQYKLLGFMLGFILIWLALPSLVWGSKVYQEYFDVVTRFQWYGDSWNGSVFGVVFRVLLVSSQHLENLALAKGIAFLSSLLMFALYLKQLNCLEDSPTKPLGFCLTLVCMLMLSPLGWIYYFPLLLLPFFLTLSYLDPKQTKLSVIWFMMFVFLSFPMEYVRVVDMTHVWQRLSVYSLPFWGLCMLFYLLCNKRFFSSSLSTFEFSLLLPVLMISLFTGGFFWLGLGRGYLSQ